MAKIQIKSEKLTPFGGILWVMEQFNNLLAQTIVFSIQLFSFLRNRDVSGDRKKFAIHCKFHSEAQEICNALQISRKSFVYLQRISFLAIKIECKMNSKVNK